PAEYLIDKSGRIRHTHFGEGEYGQTESVIRELLGANGSRAQNEPDATPTEAMSPETYLGYARIANYVGSQITPDEKTEYHLPSTLPDSSLAYGGEWTIGAQKIVAGRNATLRFHFHAKDVYIVLGGRGTVQELVDGRPTGTLHVNAERLYTVRQSNTLADA